jgi:hypothetical protein
MTLMAASLMLPAPCHYAFVCLVLFLLSIESSPGDIKLPTEATPPPPSISGLERLAPRPESHVLDAARVFAFESDLYHSLSTELINALEQEGIEIHVAAYSFILNESIDERAARLREAWLSDRHGVVIVYDTSAGNLTMAATEDYRHFLSQVEWLHIFARAAASAREQDESSERIAAAVGTVLAEVPPRLRNRPANQPLLDQHSIHIGAAVLGALLILFALGTLFVRFQRRADAAKARFYYFPSVHIDPRFGAPNGGGAMAERHFTAGARPAGNPLSVNPIPAHE